LLLIYDDCVSVSAPGIDTQLIRHGVVAILIVIYSDSLNRKNRILM
jgi:hypothetical protein